MEAITEGVVVRVVDVGVVVMLQRGLATRSVPVLRPVRESHESVTLLMEFIRGEKTSAPTSDHPQARVTMAILTPIRAQ